MAPEKVFLEVARKLLEFTFGDWSDAEGASLTLLPIFEHGLQFRFNEITYFLEH